MHQILAGSSKASPTSQYLPSEPSGTQLATRAKALLPAGSSSIRTDKPQSTGRDKRTPQPSGLTTSVWQRSLSCMVGSWLVTRIGSCARIRVLRRGGS